LLDNVNKLLESKIGDSARLEHIKESIENNNPLYDSDKKYLDKLSQKHSTSENKQDLENNNPYLNPKDTENEKSEKHLGFEEKLKIAESKIDKLTENVKHQEDMEYKQNYYKNEGTALVLALILGILGINGVGHIYVGKVWKGIGIFVGSLVLLIIGFATLGMVFGIAFIFVYVLIWILQIIESKKLCRQYNDYLRQTGKQLW